MLKSWTKILPFFFIEWYAKRKCQKFAGLNNTIYVEAYKGVRIYVSGL